MFHEAAEVRAAALRAIRYLLKDEITVKSILRVNLPIFIVRSIDVVLENRTERIQALRLVRKFLSISPQLFPPAFTRSLVAIAQDGLTEHDSLTRACWALLAELSIMCPTSSTKDTQNNAFNAIMDATLAGNQPHGMCESLIATLLYLLNWPNYRCLIRGELDLQIFVAPFTDSHYTAPLLKDQKQGMNQSTKFDADPYDQRESRFNAAKITLISILRSWQGLIYLCEPQSSESNLVTKSCLKSLVNMLNLPYNDVRRRLIDLLFELLYMPLPESSTGLKFESGLKILEKHQLSRDSWKIHDAFIVDEAKALLPPLRSKSKMNLVNDYMALLLVALFHCDIVDALSEVIITPSNQENSVRATILLYQLLSLSYQYLPTDSFSEYLTLSNLIAHATSKADDSRDLANAALINLGRVGPLRKPCNSSARYSVFLSQILEFCSPHLLVSDVNDIDNGNTCSKTSAQLEDRTIMSNRSESSTSSASTLVNLRSHSRSPSISSRSTSFISKSSTISTAASFLSMFSFPPIAKSSLKSMSEQNWESWDWGQINFLLTRPCESLKRLSSQHYRNFIRKLIHFYKPSSDQYSLIDINNECARRLCDTGCKLIDFLVESPELKAKELLKELLHDISISMLDPDSCNHNTPMNIRKSCIKSRFILPTLDGSSSTSQINVPITHHRDANMLSSSKLISTLSSTYFLFIGRLSHTMKGYQLLQKSSIIERINNITQEAMPASSPAEVYIRLIISCLDYTKEFNGSRKLLEKFLFEHPEESVKLYATNFLRVLLRANVIDFSSWGIELLVKQLCSPLRVIHFTAADILDEACDLEENLEGLVTLKQTVNPQTQATVSVLEILRSAKDLGIILLCRYASSTNGLKFLIETPRRSLSCPIDSILVSRKEANKEDPIGELESNKPFVKVESEFDVELDRWRNYFNYRYVKLVEDVLNDSLTYHQKGDDGKYGRRIDRINPMAKNSYLPDHLYGQLALNSEGIEIISSRNLLEPVYEILYNAPKDLNYSEASLIRFKAALWILGHIGSSEQGYQLLNDTETLIKMITELARTAAVLSLRGTAFYVLGLLGSTDEGAEAMKAYGWIAQKSNIVALPLYLDLILKRPQDDINDECCKTTTSSNQDHIVSSSTTTASLNHDNFTRGRYDPINSKSPSLKADSLDSNSIIRYEAEMEKVTTDFDQGMSSTLPATNENIISIDNEDLHQELKKCYSHKELEQIRKDILKYVTNLSGSVAYRPSENSLLEFKRSHGKVFQFDIGLYTEVCRRLATCNFRLHARRFLQELFLDIQL